MLSTMLQMHLQYKEWQVKRLLAAVKALPTETFEQQRGSSHGSIKGTLQHIYGADFVWLQRLKGHSLTRADVHIPETLDELERRWLKLLAEWRAWASSIDEAAWHRTLDYTLFSGSPGSNPFWQVLLHVVNHGTQHGGQVMAMLRQAGVTPPAIDILMFYCELQEPPASA
ncbi:MAG TPA: DinB family protein [Terriglobales bacterium]|nr:DinB family protein [Terriglobales bacterium]